MRPFDSFGGVILLIECGGGELEIPFAMRSPRAAHPAHPNLWYLTSFRHCPVPRHTGLRRPFFYVMRLVRIP
jgi:hypothetical protein